MKEQLKLKILITIIGEIMFGTKEQQKKMLEAIERRNESIEALRQSFCKGMKKLDEQSDDLLKNLNKLKKS